MRSVLLLLALAALSYAYSSQEIIEEVNRQRLWKAGHNEYFDNFKSLEQIKKLMGWKPKPNSRPVPKKVHEVQVDLPTNFDSSQQWPKCTTIGTIYNQAECGSCWAFGCVEAVQDRFCIQSKNFTVVQLSFMDMVACGPDDGCEGGEPGDAWYYAQQSGLVTAACYPYNIPTCPPAQQPCTNFVPTPNCVQQCQDSETWSQSLHYTQSTYGVGPDQTSIMQEIYQNGPVEACFSVYEDFLHYKSGVYRHTSGGFLGGHCIKIIGWGVDSDGTPYWLCNNSWTTYWGDKGQFKILRGQDECGIEDQVVAGMAYSN